MQHPQPDPQPLTPAAVELRTKRLVSIIGSSIRALASLIGEDRAFVAEAIYRAETGRAPPDDGTTLVAFASTTTTARKPIVRPITGHHMTAAPFDVQSHYRDDDDLRFWYSNEQTQDSQGHVWSRELKLTTDNYGTLVEVAA